MSLRTSYAHEKLMLTVHSLSTGPGDIRKRLVHAHLIFHTLQNKDFHKELQKDWEWIIKELTKFGPVYDYKGEPYIGSVQNTCNKIKNKTGVKIAEKIYEMYRYLESH